MSSCTGRTYTQDIWMYRCVELAHTRTQTLPCEQRLLAFPQRDWDFQLLSVHPEKNWKKEEWWSHTHTHLHICPHILHTSISIYSIYICLSWVQKFTPPYFLGGILQFKLKTEHDWHIILLHHITSEYSTVVDQQKNPTLFHFILWLFF